MVVHIPDSGATAFATGKSLLAHRLGAAGSDQLDSHPPVVCEIRFDGLCALANECLSKRCFPLKVVGECCWSVLSFFRDAFHFRTIVDEERVAGKGFPLDAFDGTHL